jgi:hypothetical protein
MASSPTPHTAPTSISDQPEVRIVSHSSLFYWWPIWVLAAFMGMWTMIEDRRLAIVPANSQLKLAADQPSDKTVFDLIVPGKKDEKTGRYQTKSIDTAVKETERALALAPHDPPFKPRVSQAAWMGPLFCIFLMLVIFITNVPLRGLWSVIALISIALITVLLAFFDLWDDIFHRLAGLHIYINMAGYFFIAAVLFLMWGLVILFFDQQIYMVFTPGQMRVRTEIGGGETSYDTMGLTTEKHRDDLFRHWVLGLGSGDLTVRTSGAQAHTFTMPNVLFVGSKLRQIQEMMRDKPVVQG